MPGMWCKSCGQEIGHPSEDLHDPDNLSGIPEDFGEQGFDNPDAHIKAINGPGGEGHRFHCRPSGKITSLVDHPPGQEPPPEESSPPGGDQSEEPTEETGGEPTQQQQQQQRQRQQRSEVYDLKEDKTPKDLVQQVVTNEIYGLNDGQIGEMRDWVNIYDGRIPPDRFEEILRDFDGVSKQKARLMRTKYEVMLDREMRRQADDRGPSIGATASAGRMPGGGGGPPQGAGGPPQPQPPPSTPDDDSISPDDDLRKERRRRRVERRNDAFDKAAEEFADKAAREMASDFGKMFGDVREILHTVFKKKAETDPDWFFEKAEKWDLEILDTILEPSERRKEELDGREMDLETVDAEIDEALAELEEEESGGDESVKHEPDTEEEEMPSDRIELDDIMAGEQ